VGHPLGRLGYATADAVYLSAGRIDALLVCRGRLARTADPQRTRFGLAQVRRYVSAGELSAVHVIFAPDSDRPLLLGIARLCNASAEPLAVEYTETWAVAGSDYREAAGACERRTGDGMRALAELSLASSAVAVEPPRREGLALRLNLLLPPHSRRELHFAYAAPALDEPADALIRAWRGRVPQELAQSVASWSRRLGPGDAPVAAYREQVTRAA
jgi:hypothetical protein